MNIHGILFETIETYRCIISYNPLTSCTKYSTNFNILSGNYGAAYMFWAVWRIFRILEYSRLCWTKTLHNKQKKLQSR